MSRAVVGVAGAVISLAYPGAAPAINALMAVANVAINDHERRKARRASEEARNKGRTIMFRSTVAPRQTVYGEAVVSGPILFQGVSGTTNKYLHLVIALAGHEVASIGDVWFGDKLASEWDQYGSKKKVSCVVTDTDVGVSDPLKMVLNGLTYQADDDLLSNKAGLVVDQINASGDYSASWTGDSGRVVITVEAVSAVNDFTTGGSSGFIRVLEKQLAPYQITRHLGTSDQLADPDLIAAAPDKWTDNHRLRGIAYLHVKLQWSPDLWPFGVPNIKASIKGKPVYDPRTGQTAWSDNWALCARDYLVDKMGGAVDENRVIASANISDEIIDTVLNTAPHPGAETGIKINHDSYTSSNTGEAYLHRALKNGGSSDEDGYVWWEGSKITVPRGMLATNGSQSGALDGYIIFDTTLSAKFAMASGLPDAHYVFAIYDNGQWKYDNNTSLVDFSPAPTDAVIGVMSMGSGETIASAGMWVYAKPALDILQKKYAVNGAFTDDIAPAGIIEDLETAGGGSIDYIEGRWIINAGHPEASVGTLTEDHLRGPLKFRAKTSKRDRFNAVKGTFFSPDNNWLESDFPILTNTLYEQEDGEQIALDIKLPYTSNHIACQRLAKIILKKSRHSIIVEFPATLSAVRYKLGSIIDLDIAQLGWSGKAFEVIDWSLSSDLGVDLVLKEYAGEFFDWDKNESKHIEFAAETDLPDPHTVSAPSGVQIFNGEAHAKNQDGSIAGSVQVQWTSNDDRDDHYLVEKQVDGGWEWVASPRDTNVEINNLINGQVCVIRVRAVSGIGIKSAPTPGTSHIVDVSVPQLSIPQNINHSIDGNSPVTIISAGRRVQPVLVFWDAVSDPHCVGYQISRRLPGEVEYTVFSQTPTRTENRASVDLVQGQGNTVRVRALSALGAAGHSDWGYLTITPSISNDHLTTVGAYMGVPFPVRSQTVNLTINIDNNNPDPGLFKIMEYPIDGAYNSLSFDGLFSVGGSNGRLEKQSRVSFLFSTGSSPQAIDKKVYAYSAGEAAGKLYIYYDTLGDGTHTVRIYVWLQAWEGALLTGDWSVNTSLENGHFYSYMNETGAHTFNPVGTQVTPTANYQPGATVGALPAEVADIETAKTTAASADLLAGSAQNAAEAAQDTADRNEPFELVSDPQFTKTVAPHGNKHWNNLGSDKWFITTDSGSETPVARINPAAVIHDCGTVNAHPTKAWSQYSVTIDYYVSPDYNSEFKVFLDVLDSNKNRITINWSDTLGAPGIPTGFLTKKFLLTASHNDAAYIRPMLSDRGTGSTGYVFVSRISVLPVIDFLGVGGDTRPEDNATVGGRLGNNLTDESGAVIGDPETLNFHQSWEYVGGQQYTDGDTVIFNGNNQHLYNQSPNVWGKIASVYVPRFGDCRVRLVTQLGASYDINGGSTTEFPHTHTIEIRINGAVRHTATLTAYRNQTYTLDYPIPAVSAGDIIEAWAKPSGTVVAIWDGNQTFFAFGVLSGQQFNEAIA